MGRVDELRGFKENVILGHLIPGGTGFSQYRYLKLVPQCEALSDEEMEVLREEQRKAHAEIFGIPAKIEGEEEDGDESDLQSPAAPTLLMDTGDTSADGGDILDAAETAGGGDGELI